MFRPPARCPSQSPLLLLPLLTAPPFLPPDILSFTPARPPAASSMPSAFQSCDRATFEARRMRSGQRLAVGVGGPLHERGQRCAAGPLPGAPLTSRAAASMAALLARRTLHIVLGARPSHRRHRQAFLSGAVLNAPSRPPWRRSHTAAPIHSRCHALRSPNATRPDLAKRAGRLAAPAAPVSSSIAGGVHELGGRAADREALHARQKCRASRSRTQRSTDSS